MSQAAGYGPRLQLPPVAWRREWLYLCYAGMEVCWITPLVLSFLRGRGPGSPAAIALVLFSLMVGFLYLARLADRATWEISRARALMILALPVAVLVAWRIFLHTGVPLADLRWIQAAGTDMVSGHSGGHWLILVLVLFLWWRGLSLSRREFVFASVALAFRSGILLLVVGTVLATTVAGQPVNSLIYLFFLCSLLAVALTRLEEVGLITGEAGRSFDAFWLGLLVAAVGALLGVGLLLGLVASPEGIAAIRSLWAPIGDGLISAVVWLMALLLRPFEPWLQWLANAIAANWDSVLNEQWAEALAQWEPVAGEAPQPRSGVVLAAAWTVLRLACGGGLVMALVLAGLWTLSQRRARQRELSEQHSRIDAGLLDTLAGLWQSGRDRLRQVAELAGHFGLGSGLLAAITVHNIYANTARLAGQRGYPRHPARTPYEYLPDLVVAFPGADAEVRAITDAYVGVHYGELPSTGEELERLRAAFERLRSTEVGEP